MTQRRKFSAEYKREAVAMVEVPGVTVHQVATELGIGAGMLGRWRRELRQETPRTFPGHGRPREEEVVQLKRERVNRRQYRTRAEARADLFDYIERWHNLRQRRRLAVQQQGEALLTHLSVETG